MQLENSIFQFLVPLNFGFFSVAFFVVYLRHREFGYSAWIALVFAVGCFGSMIEIFHPRLSLAPLHFDDLTNSCYCGASALLVIALAKRFGRKVPWVALVAIGATGVLAQLYLGHLAPDLEARTIAIDMVAGSLMALTLVVIPANSRRVIDRILFWLFAAIAFTYFLRVGILVAYLGGDHVWADQDHSVYVIMLFFASSLVGLAGGIGLLVLTAMDLLDKYRLASVTDPLTGLLNRRGLEERFDAMSARSDGAALIVVDLDWFKQVNDSYGHSAGDAVLTRVAHAARKNLAGFGEISRIGGEEFVILIQGAARDTAWALAEQLRFALGTLDHQEIGGRSITMSAGIAWILPGETPQSALRRADMALYAAKEAGRNCVREAVVPVGRIKAVA